MLLSFKGKMGIAVKGLYYKPEDFLALFFTVGKPIDCPYWKSSFVQGLVFLVMGIDTISGSCACNGQASAGRTTVS